MNIFVNATSADVGGAFTITDQFIQSVKLYDQKNIYYIFVSNNKFDHYKCETRKIIKVNAKKWVNRFLWDTFGIKKWSTKHKIKPDKIISLQNTPVNYPTIKQIVYIHTTVPFLSYKWRLFNNKERILWFYKNIYPFFIKIFLNDNCKIIVQANWFKNIVTKKMKVNPDRIFVVKPNSKLTITDIKVEKSDIDYRLFFYPAADYVYKNHLIILKAMRQLKISDKELYREIKIIFTLDESSWVYKEAIKLEVNDQISFVGHLEKEEVLQYYLNSQAILFPSYIETVGLPLLESAQLKKYIICSDEEFAHEMLCNYNYVSYVPTHNSIDWMTEIIKSLGVEGNIGLFNEVEEEGWGKFFDIAKS
ncbi:glycosyltransferase [Fictibacillus sp. KU28468]|uniref:glycosyltransferase n=1 Tax=Fictibacillus sp. KU28468 TaxID=2991053 RepID=UPI00223D664C|nr:glycosyltransferase [Fictibacillus sp. KU28468]UZJ79346.1 glycosyltransferase [Fictibacillus sp. KU28468]